MLVCQQRTLKELKRFKITLRLWACFKMRLNRFSHLLMSLMSWISHSKRHTRSSETRNKTGF